jgi:hypothetical protein
MLVDPRSHTEDIFSQGVERTFGFFKGVSRFFETLVNEQHTAETSPQKAPTAKYHMPLTAWEVSGLAGRSQEESINASSPDASLEFKPEIKVRV